MSIFKSLDPADIDESLVKLVELSGQRHVLLPFVDATGAAPEYRSVGHPTSGDAVRMADLEAITAAMRARAKDAAWFIVFSTPWLLAKSAAEELRKAAAARR